MPDTTDLHIPDEAFRRVIVLADATYETDDEIAESARWIAAPVVVAELIRIADELAIVRAEMREADGRTIRSSALGEGIARLRARAAELDGDAR